MCNCGNTRTSKLKHFFMSSQDRTVGIVTRLRAEAARTNGSIPGKGMYKIYSFLRSIKNISPFHCIPTAYTPAVTGTVCKDEHSAPVYGA
jgi:hypothetical protein